MLEAYLSSINDMLSHLESLSAELSSYESQLSFRLDLAQHHLLIYSTLFTVISALCATSAMLFGIFSQNMAVADWRPSSDLAFVVILTGGALIIVVPVVVFMFVLIREGFIFV